MKPLRPERGECPLCQRSVAGVRLDDGNLDDGTWLPVQNTEHDPSCSHYRRPFHLLYAADAEPLGDVFEGESLSHPHPTSAELLDQAAREGWTLAKLARTAAAIVARDRFESSSIALGVALGTLLDSTDPDGLPLVNGVFLRTVREAHAAWQAAGDVYSRAKLAAAGLSPTGEVLR